MQLKNTIEEMRNLLVQITEDLEKADNGNKAASQRVRTGTVKLEKIAKHYRKASIQDEKHTKGDKKDSNAKKVAVAKPKAKTAPAPAKAVAAKAPAKAQQKTTAKPRGFTVKKSTAKLPSRRG